MNYKIARELRDAGFPHTWCSEAWCPEDDCSCLHEPSVNFVDYVKSQPGNCFPALSELIEACGDGIYGLHRMGEQWNAVSDDRKNGKAISISGSTPEEAVARLWLALNMK